MVERMICTIMWIKKEMNLDGIIFQSFYSSFYCQNEKRFLEKVVLISRQFFFFIFFLFFKEMITFFCAVKNLIFRFFRKFCNVFLLLTDRESSIVEDTKVLIKKDKRKEKYSTCE